MIKVIEKDDVNSKLELKEVCESVSDVKYINTETGNLEIVCNDHNGGIFLINLPQHEVLELAAYVLSKKK